MIDNVGYEITTYRRDGEYSDGRHPDSVEFTSNLIEDLSRRDFTINAMAYNEKDGLIDPFNGMQDIENHFIRCVGIAKDRFTEDALRILRAMRFASQLEFVIDAEAGYEISHLYKSLENISTERINSELCKMIVAPDFVFRWCCTMMCLLSLSQRLKICLDSIRIIHIILIMYGIIQSMQYSIVIQMT